MGNDFKPKSLCSDQVLAPLEEPRREGTNLLVVVMMLVGVFDLGRHLLVARDYDQLNLSRFAHGQMGQ